MTLSKEQWQDIEESLSYPYGTVKLKCDGHDVAAVVSVYKRRLVVDVYVDGVVAHGLMTKARSVINFTRE